MDRSKGKKHVNKGMQARWMARRIAMTEARAAGHSWSELAQMFKVHRNNGRRIVLDHIKRENL